MLQLTYTHIVNLFRILKQEIFVGTDKNMEGTVEMRMLKTGGGLRRIIGLSTPHSRLCPVLGLQTIKS